MTAWNDALTVAGNDGLYNAYGDYFNDLRDAGMGRIPHTSDYRVQVQAGPAKVYYLTKPGDYGGIALHQLAGATVVHSKYLLIEGGYDGVADQQLVFTGSHTYTLSALQQNDEALLKYDDPQVYDAYRSDFWRLRDHAG